MHPCLRGSLPYALPGLAALALAAAVGASLAPQGAPKDGPANPKPQRPVKTGDAAHGRYVFRDETFGIEGFWTDAVRMPQGFASHRLTPLGAIKLGMSFDSERIPEDLRDAMAEEAKTDLSPANAPKMNDPAVLTRLITADALIGWTPRPGGKIGMACALCHSITDQSVFRFKDKGGIGKRIDGPSAQTLEIGKIFALADNSRALYPILQLDQGKNTVGRVPTYRLTKNSTEAQVDAYLDDARAWPPGMLDDTPDGLGNPVHIAPFFRTDIAGPWGSQGQNNTLDDFNNTAWTVVFELSNLTSPGGRKFVHGLAGAPGDKMVNDYDDVLKKTGVKGYPYVVANGGFPAGKPPTPAGKRVDDKSLFDLNAYTNSLPATKGHPEDAEAVARGREAFRAQCTSCHNVDPLAPLDFKVLPYARVWPGYVPKVVARRKPPLSPIVNSPGLYDNKTIVVDGSVDGNPRGDALPLLLDLWRKPAFLHDDSVKTLDALLDPSRGPKAPHPYYVPDAARREDVRAFLRSLGQG